MSKFVAKNKAMQREFDLLTKTQSFTEMRSIGLYDPITYGRNFKENKAASFVRAKLYGYKKTDKEMAKLSRKEEYEGYYYSAR